MNKRNLSETLASLGGLLILASLAWSLNFYGQTTKGDTTQMIGAASCLLLPGANCGLPATGAEDITIWPYNPIPMWIGLGLFVFGLILARSDGESSTKAGIYVPPVQSKLNQLLDSLNLMMLVLVGLFAPLRLGLAGGGKKPIEFAEKSWAGMNQNETMVAQWEKLGLAKDDAGSIPQSTVDMIASRFDYTFDPISLALTALLVIAYFYIVLHWSKKEYRDVIDEKFNNK